MIIKFNSNTGKKIQKKKKKKNNKYEIDIFLHVVLEEVNLFTKIKSKN